MKFESLKPGDQIALIAPSSPFDGEKLKSACRILENNGYETSLGRHIFQRNDYLAGTEAERAEDLIDALLNPAVSAIICIRGGYGSGRLLHHIPFSSIQAQRPKFFLGHSDVTFLHMAFQSKLHWPTFHGPNLIDMGEVPERTENVLALLRAAIKFRWHLEKSDILRHGKAVGPVLGGNLTCLAHLIGTPFFPKTTGALLLIEDCNEAPYRIDRLMTHLKMAGVLRELGGLILGQFSGCGDPQKLHHMIFEQVREFRFPVIANLPFGHGIHNEVLPLGIPFSLDTYERKLEANYNLFSK
jgi:muramoyltetrapeptide carboxypeptidase